jgi:N-ethylmaleimide reductase
VENKARWLLEVVQKLTSVWGSQRVSVRISPLLSYSGRVDAPEATLPAYTYVAEQLNASDLAFLHVLARREPGVTDEQCAQRQIFKIFCALYHGVLMANGSLTRESAEELIRSGQADLVSCGAAYIANPNSVYRLAHNLPLPAGNPDTYLMGDDNGYTDYAALTHSLALT